MNYELISDTQINVDIDCYLSANYVDMRPAYDMASAKCWGQLARDNKISILFIEGTVMAFNYDTKLSNEYAHDNVGRAVSICFLKMMAKK